jgi:N-acetylneuraminate synthase
MNDYKKPFVIAEIGCNHKGDMEIAKELIKIASIFCNVDAVKFQKRNNLELLTEEQYNAPHPNASNSYGATYGAHREYLEFYVNQHAELKKYCEEIGIIYSTSVWDTTSAKEIASLNPAFIKIPSACNNNYEMLDWLCENYFGEIHISTGMTTKNETDILVNYFIEKERNSDLVLYNCTSGYPVPFEDVCLLEINLLKQKYGDKVKHIGFSGHHLGIAVDIAAYTLGANIIERHYTIDRTWKGTDHAASLEPMGLRKLTRDLHAVYHALTFKKTDILPIEQVQRDKLKNKKVSSLK